MRFIIRYVIEREEEVEVSNFNEASERAMAGKRKGELILSVRSK